MKRVKAKAVYKGIALGKIYVLRKKKDAVKKNKNRKSRRRNAKNETGKSHGIRAD